MFVQLRNKLVVANVCHFNSMFPSKKLYIIDSEIEYVFRLFYTYIFVHAISYVQSNHIFPKTLTIESLSCHNEKLLFELYYVYLSRTN